MNMKLKLSQLLQRSRIEQGYTQREVAEAVSVSMRWYQKVEAGKKLPGSLTLIRLVLFLRIDMEDLREDAGLIVPVSSPRSKAHIH